MGTTPNRGWPYPESSDYVADGATAIENLADALDDSIGRGYTLERTIYYASSDTFTKASYPWLRAIRVTVVGGGAGGGGAEYSGFVGYSASGGGGGAGGAARAFIIDIAGLAASETITIGAGGSGGAGTSSGTSGGTSSAFGVSCGGGSGGAGGGRTNGSDDPQGGNGGSASGGNINIPGQAGGSALTGPSATAQSGAGGNSGFGLGLGGAIRTTNPSLPRSGRAAEGYGSGGGGAVASESVATTGGAGRKGIVIVELYA